MACNRPRMHSLLFVWYGPSKCEKVVSGTMFTIRASYASNFFVLQSLNEIKERFQIVIRATADFLRIDTCHGITLACYCYNYNQVINGQRFTRLTSYRFSDVNWKRISGRRFLNHSVANITARSAIACVNQCTITTVCDSVNFRQLDRACALNAHPLGAYWSSVSQDNDWHWWTPKTMVIL